jgi:uncharacterized protein (TIGR03437 family)
MKTSRFVCFLLPLAAFAQSGAQSVTARVSAILADAGSNSTQGLYLKQVGGAVLADQRSSSTFDGAGSVAIMPVTYALFRDTTGFLSVNDLIQKYTNPKGACPTPPVVSGTESLQAAMQEMMWHDNDARALAVQTALGRGVIDSFSRALGLSRTTLAPVPGCQQPARTTLAELTSVYENVTTGALLPLRKAQFFNLLAGKPQATAENSDYDHLWDTDIPAIIAKEAPAGATEAQKTQFRNSMDLGYKSGATAFCLQNDCTAVSEDLSIAGWAKVPYCAGGQNVPREVVFGIFISGAPDQAYTPGKLTLAKKAYIAARAELLREVIRDGLNSCYGADAVMVTPAPGSILTSRTVTFGWSAGANATGYRLDLGRSIGGAELGTIFTTTSTSTVATNLPCDGNAVTARLWTKRDSFGSPKDYTFRACNNGGPVVTSPTPGTTLSSSSVTFTWSALATADQYRLSVGTTFGGNDIAAVGTNETSATVADVPRDRIVFVRISAHIETGGTTVPNDYAYNNNVGQTPAITSVVNAASLQSRLSPGCLAVVNGFNFANDVIVAVNGARAQLVGSPTATQITFLVPLNAQQGIANFQIASGNAVSPGVLAQIAAASPGLYPLLDGSGAEITPARPVKPGEVLTGRAVGLGPIGTDGRPTLGISIRIGTLSAPLLTVTPLASSPGVVQFTFRVPETVSSGTQQATVQAGSFASNAIPILIPGPSINGILNAATFASNAKVAPGSLVSLFGTDVASDDGFGLYPSAILPGGGVLTVNGVTAPLFDVVASGGQINFLVPFEAPTAGTVPVAIANSLGTSAVYQMAMAPAAPGIFRIGDPSNDKRFNAAALLANTAWRVMPSSMAAALGIQQDCRASKIAVGAICGEPAAVGDGIQIYVTGLGRATPNGNPVGNQLRTGDVAPASGSPLYRTVETPRVTIGGIDATVLFSGIAPGFAGLYQINVTIPPGVASGDDVPVVITIGGVSDTATIAVR